MPREGVVMRVFLIIAALLVMPLVARAQWRAPNPDVAAAVTQWSKQNEVIRQHQQTIHDQKKNGTYVDPHILAHRKQGR
jgi:hypothetical protein